MSEEKLVPKLRFSGFKNLWDTYKLKDLLQNKSSNISINQLDENIGEYPLYGAGGFLKSIDFYEMDCDYISIVKDGSGVGNISFHEKNSSIVNTSQYLLPKDNIDINFIFYLLQTINLDKYKTGSTIPHIYFKDYSIEKVHIPKLDEQSRIGFLFKNIDLKIKILEKKCQNYQEFKKYLMQQIFTQKLRFDFTYEWDKYLLGDISIISKGFTPSTSNPDYWDGNLKWLSIADMNQGKYINQTTKKITYEGSKNKEPIKKGTLLMSFKLSIGKLGILNEDMYTNEAICNFQWKNKKIMTEYMYYYLSSINILKYGSQAAKGITLNNETLSAIPVLLPSIEEQNKIIDILSNLDLKINMLENNINITSKFKKGLLQQMFV